ncbi:hypothetical protein BSKO_13716 [Bryopsis sp. KO-2023]|nr:hypothetical protein BSKO_13716 [Bryopsis sp. KO-2023]
MRAILNARSSLRLSNTSFSPQTCLRAIHAERRESARTSCSLHSDAATSKDAGFIPSKLQFFGRKNGRDFSGVCQAKGKKKGGKKGKKKAGSLMTPSAPTVEPWFSTDSIMRLLVLVENYKRATGKFLLEDADIAEIAKDVWQAPFCLLANDFTQSDSPAKATYVNKPFLDCMELNWTDIVGKPAAEMPESVSPLFESWVKSLGAAEKGVIVEGFTAKAKNFEIQEGTAFVLKSPADKPLGQVLIFDKWVYEDGAKGGVGITDPQKIPTEEDIAAAEGLVTEQAQVVRNLKEEKGLTNKDEEVQQAVAVLLERKEKVAELEKLLEEAASE